MSMQFGAVRRDSLLGKLTHLHWFLLLSVCAIAAFGIAVLVSAASNAHDIATGQPKIDLEYAFDHASRFVVLLILAVVAALVPIRLWAAVAFPVYVIGVLLLIGVEVAGVTVKGGERWLQLGPLRLQPSELMKLAVPLALARYYHQVFAANRQGFWIHVPALILVVIPTYLVYRQPDLGTALMIMGTGCMVIFFAGINLIVVCAALVAAAISGVVAYFFLLHDYQLQRIKTLFDPNADPLGAGYQLQQALIAIGSGGIGGKGYLEGTQKQLDFIPEQHTDFIFTIPAEEFGFAGSIVLLLFWIVVLLQGMQISINASRPGQGNAFATLASAGFVSTLALYVIINIGMVIGLLPVVGIPLPLISYGGTVMLTVMIGFGLLLAVHLNGSKPMALQGVI
jgi:rod shape determining protein RodA